MLPAAFADDPERLARFTREAQTLVSTAGGMTPRWRDDGKELYYVGPEGTLRAVSVAAFGGPPQLGAPDGRFLINAVSGDEVTAPITVIPNWAPKK